MEEGRIWKRPVPATITTRLFSGNMCFELWPWEEQQITKHTRVELSSQVTARRIITFRGDEAERRRNGRFGKWRAKWVEGRPTGWR